MNMPVIDDVEDRELLGAAVQAAPTRKLRSASPPEDRKRTLVYLRYAPTNLLIDEDPDLFTDRLADALKVEDDIDTYEPWMDVNTVVMLPDRPEFISKLTIRADDVRAFGPALS